MIGQTVSHYKILEKLGQGGMGVVYKAEDTKLKRIVALKFLPANALTTEEEKTRFVREAQSAAALDHPNICTIYEIDEADGQTFISMAYVEGRDLKQIVAKGPMKLADVVNVAIQVGQGLQEAHDNKIVHRDIKSANIMVTDKGRAEIMDFGLAKQRGQTALTQEGTSMGTIDYMSPEQARGDEVDRRSDIWSLGVMLYEMITGRVPFRSEKDQGVIFSILNDVPEPLTAVRTGVPMELERIVTKALAKNAAERYQNMGDVVVDLQAVQRDMSGATATIAAETAATRPEGVSLVRHLIDRRVPQVFGVYLGASFAVISFLQFLVNRFPLSPYLPDFSLVMLTSLIPTVLLVGYFHGRSGTNGWHKIEKVGVPVNVLASAVLLFFIFQNKDLGATTTTITVSDETGNVVEHVVPKSEFRKRVAVFYFDNESGDPSNDWLQHGLIHLLRYELYQDNYVTVWYGFTSQQKKAGFETGVGSPLTLKKKIAADYHFPYFLTGSFSATDDRFTVRAGLYETKSGKAISKREYSGDDLFGLVDALSVELRRDMEIPDYHIEESQDLPVSEVFTKYLEALKGYSLAVVAVADNDYQAASGFLDEATGVDPAFAVAHWRAFSVNSGLNRRDDAMASIRMGVKHKYKLPERIQFSLMEDYYSNAEQDLDAAVETAKRWVALYPQELNGHLRLAGHYERMNQLDAAIKERQLIMELDPERHGEIHQIARLYEQKGEFNEALGYYQQYVDRFPAKYESFTRLAGFYRTIANFEKARENYKKALVIEPDRMFIRTTLAEIERSIGSFDGSLQQSMDALDYATTARDSSTVLWGLIQHHSFRGESKRALEYYEQNIEVMQGFSSPIDLMFTQLFSAGIYVNAGETEKIFAILDNIKAQPSMPQLRSLVSAGYIIAYAVMDDPANADVMESRLKEYEAFIDATGTEQFRWVVELSRSTIQRWRGQHAEALESAQKALDGVGQNQNESIILLNCLAARSSREMGSFELGQSYAEQALAIQPFSPFANYEMALLNYDMGKKDEALKNMRRTLQAWENADDVFKPATDARETAAQWQTEGLQVQ